MKMKLDSFEHEAQELQNVMEQVSTCIKKVEAALKASKMHIGFVGPIEQEDEDAHYFISWNKLGDTFRLMYSEKNQENCWSRPLIETKFEIRMKCLPHLPKFLEEYSKFINDKKTKLKQAIELLQDLDDE